MHYQCVLDVVILVWSVIRGIKLVFVNESKYSFICLSCLILSKSMSKSPAVSTGLFVLFVISSIGIRRLANSVWSIVWCL